MHLFLAAYLPGLLLGATVGCAFALRKFRPARRAPRWPAGWGEFIGEAIAIADPYEQAEAVIDYLDRDHGIAGVREFYFFMLHRVNRGHDPGLPVLAREFFSLRDRRLRCVTARRPVRRPAARSRPRARRSHRIQRRSCSARGDPSGESDPPGLARRRRARCAARGGAL